ncbi:putative N-acetylneuramic acid synthetase (NeuB) [Legionella busanensis]|uniref:Putative N-acetylneuramic acid synthetase (NeuB) n=1 Tax=Legionella busanensis TaxID=190655 RepID=A0A378JL26_9GAMM|nr:N-acetylneuraminate synthase family protein [Legionella busanensis]STX51388.1 putative N-acetylneuramic acid synthetase (NeuB) [Legionella busanensis]
MEFAIAHKKVGINHPTFIIAEIGSNHNQDFKLALQHIDAAAEAGVDAVKFQTFKANTHVSKYAVMPNYLQGYSSIYDLIKTLELNRDWQRPLMEYATEKGMIFFSSACDYDAVDSLNEINVPAHKVASFDLPDLDLIRYIAKSGKPIILSTGLANWMDIQRAVEVCLEEDNSQIALLQCTSLYPAPAHLSNLKAMISMRNIFNVVTGYSDHTLGDTIPTAAVAMGAAIIEKHFTLDRTLPGPDHGFAIEPAELKEMVTKIRTIELAIGNGIKNGPREEEKDMYSKVRRSLHAKQDIKQGQIITEADIVCKRPGFGIQPYQKGEVIGKIAKVNIKADQWIEWAMI